MKDLWKASSVTRTAFAEGRTEEARRMARLVLERRFGTVGHDLLEALNRALEATLEELVLESTWSLEQVRARLGLEKDSK
jgi:hypothetical protein